jgi:glyoxylate/hydroxypyruvate reductase A
LWLLVGEHAWLLILLWFKPSLFHMALSIIAPQKDPQPWVEALQAAAPDLDIRVWPDDHPRAAISFVLSWKHPEGVFSEYPNLKGICSMGAGVDHLLKDSSIPDGITLMRIVDDALAQSMWEHLLAVVFRYMRNLGDYQTDQLHRRWKPTPYLRIADVRIGIMGLGQLGGMMARQFSNLGFKVSGWSNSAKAIPKVESYLGPAALPAFLAQSDILICLLPLTPATRHILNAATLRHCPSGAYLINVARGGVLAEEDLLPLLREGQLSGACLDVFEQEPLPEDHPFWSEPRILITPHIASLTEPASVAGQVLDNYRNIINGKSPMHTVSKSKGY